MVASRFENLVQEIVYLPLEAGDLRRKSVEQDAAARRRFFLKAISQARVEPLDQGVELDRNLADHIAGLAVGLECRAPDLPPVLIGKIGEVFGETCDQVGL